MAVVTTMGPLPRLTQLNERSILNACTQYLARTEQQARHYYGQPYNPEDTFRASVCEPWRFPLMESYYNPNEPENGSLYNQVSIVYYHGSESTPQDVAVIGTFANLYQPIPLEQIRDTPYFALSLLVPKGEVHRYKFRVDGIWQLDPVNPQTCHLENGEVWSRFFTESCTVPLTFESRERLILKRLIAHILPFNTANGQNFLNRYINALDQQSRDNQYRNTYRLDESVGVVNYIDKLLAKEESHYLNDYRVCLEMLGNILRQRIPTMDIEKMPKSAFVQLYEEMANGQVNGWDTTRYQNPTYFLKLLRRHAYTGAFTHPKYHGNAGGAGWAYLEENLLTQATGETTYNWRTNIEASLGASTEYLG